MSYDVDLVVVGGGPAGAATAIWAALSGLRVRLLERRGFPRHRPGETLHPGLDGIFRQLGVEEQVAAASSLRHQGHSVAWGSRAAFAPFGADGRGPWQGYQILREELDTILIERARGLGVDIVQPEVAIEPVTMGGRLVGVLSRKQTRARFVVDAGGGRGWLRHHLRLAVATASPPLHAYYGYCEGQLDQPHLLPALRAERHGWTWTAQIAPRQFHWTRLAFATEAGNRDPPPPLAALRPVGRVRGADVTWRHVPAAAGNGYFLVGDAAVVLDPASSHGVLRALMSGMMAGHAVVGVKSGAISEGAATAQYRDWITEWFHHDVRQLSALYEQLDPAPGWLALCRPPRPRARSAPAGI